MSTIVWSLVAIHVFNDFQGGGVDTQNGAHDTNSY